MRGLILILLFAGFAEAAEVCVTIPAGKMVALAAARDAYNAENGTALTTAEWAKLMVREAAVASELEAAASTMAGAWDQADADAMASKETAAETFDAARATAQAGW